MRWYLVIVIALGGCHDASHAADANVGDIDASATDAPPDAAAGWETVTPVSNDGDVIVEDVTYRSGALLVRAHLCRPVAAGAHKVLVYNHGGFQGLSVDPEAQRCVATAQLGYVWLGSSYRGEDGSEGHVEVCLGEVDDVLAMIHTAAEEPYVDPDRVGMYGGSHGGCITLRAVQRGAHVRAAIDLFGPTDWAPLYAYWQSQPQSGIYPQLIAVMNQAAGPPATNAAAYALRSPINYLADVPAGVPLLVTQGTSDTIVPPSQSCALAAPLGLASWHVDGTGVETAAVPAGCTGVPSMTNARPSPSWPGARYLVVYDGLGHETQSAAAMRMLQDAATFLMAKL